MDYLIDGIIIVFVLCCIIFLLFNVAKSISSSKNFPTPKDDSDKKENDKWTIIDKSKTRKVTMEIFATFGIAFWVLVISASILLFFLPFFVLGIYSATKQMANQLIEIKELLRSMKSTIQNTDPSDPDSVFYKRKD